MADEPEYVECPTEGELQPTPDEWIVTDDNRTVLQLAALRGSLRRHGIQLGEA